MQTFEIKALADNLKASAQGDQLRSSLRAAVDEMPWAQLWSEKARIYDDLFLRLARLSDLGPENNPSVVGKDTNKTVFDLGGFTLAVIKHDYHPDYMNFSVGVGSEQTGFAQLFKLDDFKDGEGEKFSVANRQYQIAGLLDGEETVGLIESAVAG